CDTTLHPTSTALTGPVARDHDDAIARGLGDRGAEERASVHGHVALYPDGRAADDTAGGVDTLDLEADPLGSRPTPVVDVAFDGRPLAIAGHVELDLEVTVGRLRGVDRLSPSRRGAREQEPAGQPGDRVSRAGPHRATHVTGGNPLAAISQCAPPSGDRNTRPSSVPQTTRAPAAARQPVSTLSPNQLGKPSPQRSNAASPSSRAR